MAVQDFPDNVASLICLAGPWRHSDMRASRPNWPKCQMCGEEWPAQAGPTHQADLTGAAVPSSASPATLEQQFGMGFVAAPPESAQPRATRVSLALFPCVQPCMHAVGFVPTQLANKRWQNSRKPGVSHPALWPRMCLVHRL